MKADYVLLVAIVLYVAAVGVAIGIFFNGGV